MLSQPEARAAYDAIHSERDVDDGFSRPWHRLVHEHLAALGPIGGKRLLEIGCGRGGFSCHLATTLGPALRVSAVDFSGAAVAKGRDRARAFGLGGIEWQVGDIQAIPFRDASFDVVVSCETIEHVADPVRAVGELARVLRPGGALLLTIPNYLSTWGLYRLYYRLRGREFREAGNQPINQCTLLPVVMGWLRRAGLRIEAVDGTGHYVFLPGRPPRDLEFLSRPRRLTRWIAHHSLIVARTR